MGLQVLTGGDSGFLSRVEGLYGEAAVRYRRVQTLFTPTSKPDLEERTIRDLVCAIQGFDFSSASSDTMQQVFMTFVARRFQKEPEPIFHARISHRHYDSDGCPWPY